MNRTGALLGGIPLPILERTGDGLGRLAYGLDRRHRRIVEQNTAFAFPQLTPLQVRQLSHRVFRHFGIMALETLQAPFLSRSQLLGRIRIENQHLLFKAMDHPRGCLIYSAHLGNWELGFMALAARLDRPVVTVAKPIKLKIANRCLTSMRSRFGNTVVIKKGAMPVLLKALRAGRTVAVLIDQGVRRTEAVEVQFLGRRTLATPAAALLALRGRMPVVPMFCTRQEGGCYAVKVQAPVTFERTGDLRRDVVVVTQSLFQALEAAIRECPEQWFWFHRRWKRTYPSVYPEYLKLRRRKRIKKGLES